MEEEGRRRDCLLSLAGSGGSTSYLQKRTEFVVEDSARGAVRGRNLQDACLLLKKYFQPEFIGESPIGSNIRNTPTPPTRQAPFFLR